MYRILLCIVSYPIPLYRIVILHIQMHSILLHHCIVSYLDPTGPSYPTTAHLILSMPIPIDSVLEAPAPNPVARVSGRRRIIFVKGRK
jgi:hypothetical protein